MHWILDISYIKDQCRARVQSAATVFNVLGHYTLNLLSLEKTSKGGIASERRRCAISTSSRAASAVEGGAQPSGQVKKLRRSFNQLPLKDDWFYISDCCAADTSVD